MPIDPISAALDLAQALDVAGERPDHSRIASLNTLLALLQEPTVLTTLRKAAGSRREADVLLVAARALVDEGETALRAWRRSKTAAPIPVAVVLEGGLVQAICSAQALPHIRFEVVDYDVEGAAPDETQRVPFVDGANDDRVPTQRRSIDALRHRLDSVR